VDALGFCGYHAALLPLPSPAGHAVADALREATDRAAALLEDEARNSERLLEIFFAAERTCASCRIGDQHFAQRINRLAVRLESQPSSVALCFPHYRAMVHAVKAHALPVLSSAQRDLLEQVVAAVGTIEHAPHARTAHASVAPNTLRWALDVVAGAAGLAPADRPVPGPDAEPDCPVCAAIVHAGERWVDALRRAATLGQDLWTAFPTCPEHIAYCARVEDERLAILVVRYAADLQLAALRRGAAALARDNEQRAAAAKSVFFRRQSPAYVLGQQRKMVTDVPRCPACERLVVARERAIGSLVQMLRGARTPVSPGTACLKHFAAAYVLAQDSEARAASVAMQAARLRRLSGVLAAANGEAAASASAVAAIREALRAWSAATPPLQDRK